MKDGRKNTRQIILADRQVARTQNNIMIRTIFLLLIVLHLLSPCSTQQQETFKPSITCYMKYDHEETISRTLNTALSYTYHQSEATHYVTVDGELCSKVGCTCFSYRSVCSHSLPGKNHFSQCTDQDRQNGIINWHRGWSSNQQCQQMRYHPETYMDLTCCDTNRCNDQPGTIKKYVETHLPIPQYPLPYVHQYHETTPTTTTTTSTIPVITTTISTRTSRRYSSHVHSSTTTRPSETDKASPANDKALIIGNSVCRCNFICHWLIFFTLAFSMWILVTK